MNNEQITILDGESIDDLQRDGLRIIQKESEGFKFGMDAVLLSDFAKDTNAEQLMDFCTGTGIIPILLSAKSRVKNYIGIDILPDMIDMASRSAQMNSLDNKIEFKCVDVNLVHESFSVHSFDAITCNPPYMKANANIKNIDDKKLVARQEIALTLDTMLCMAEKMLKFHGRLYMVHRPNRLSEIFVSMQNHNLAPKRMRMVYPKLDKAPTMVLIEAMARGGMDLRVEKPLILRNADDTETEEVRVIYGR